MLQVSDLEINDAHIIRSLWHPKLNQILIGGGDGIVRVFYDPNKSHNGAKLCVGKYFLNHNNVAFVKLSLINLFNNTDNIFSFFNFFSSSKAFQGQTDFIRSNSAHVSIFQ